MTSQITQEKALPGPISAMLKAWNAHDVDAMLALLSPEYIGLDVCQAAPQRGLSDIRQVAEGYLRAFPNLSFTVEEVIASDGHAAVRWTARGTHRGTMLHIPATGKCVEVAGVSIFDFDSAKIYRGQHIWDVAAMLREIGLLPDL